MRIIDAWEFSWKEISQYLMLKGLKLGSNGKLPKLHQCHNRDCYFL